MNRKRFLQQKHVKQKQKYHKTSPEMSEIAKPKTTNTNTATTMTTKQGVKLIFQKNELLSASDLSASISLGGTNLLPLRL